VTFTFDPNQGLVIVATEIWGPSGSAVLRLALDTGATGTLINAAPLVALGYDPASTTERIEVTTGSTVDFVPSLAVQRIVALGHDRGSFLVLCHTLPPSAAVDGLLGLDFFRQYVLSLDFRGGLIELS
jgi:hypothetical protein